MYLHAVLSGRLSVTDRGRYVHAPALPQAFYPVIECTGLDVVRYAPLVIGHAAGPAFHDQAVLGRVDVLEFINGQIGESPAPGRVLRQLLQALSLMPISSPTRLRRNSNAGLCLKKKIS